MFRPKIQIIFFSIVFERLNVIFVQFGKSVVER